MYTLRKIVQMEAPYNTQLRAWHLGHLKNGSRCCTYCPPPPPNITSVILFAYQGPNKHDPFPATTWETPVRPRPGVGGSRTEQVFLELQPNQEADSPGRAAGAARRCPPACQGCAVCPDEEETILSGAPPPFIGTLSTYGAAL